MKRLITICAVMGILLTASADVKAVLDTRLLLHFDGTDGSTTTFDSSPQNHSITLTGGAQLDTAYQVEGVSSLLLDGTNDYATVGGTETDFDICANADDWTIDFYVRHDDHLGDECYLRHGTGTPPTFPRWSLYHHDGTGEDGLAFFAGPAYNNNTISMNPRAGTSDEISDNNWHWIVFAKVGTEYGLYLDGDQVNYTLDTDTVDASGVLYVSYPVGAATAYLDGNMDELRIFHGNIFEAAPNSGYSDTITNIPEPATIALLGLGALSLIRRKRSVWIRQAHHK